MSERVTITNTGDKSVVVMRELSHPDLAPASPVTLAPTQQIDVDVLPNNGVVVTIAPSK